MTEQLDISFSKAVSDEYAALYASAEVRADRQERVSQVVSAVLEGRRRYESVALSTGVPWYVVAAIHSLTSGGDFSRHLHNGDPLTERTVSLPKHRPLGLPPFSWEQSAVDALCYAGLSPWSASSTLEACFYAIEGLFGFGARLRSASARSPAVWGATNHDSRDVQGPEIGAAALFLGLAPHCEALLPATSGSRGLSLDVPSDAALPYPGRILMRGSTDRAMVKQCQARLNARGCGPINEDGFFGANTEAATKLFQARSVDRYGRPLRSDGRIGPFTWEALFGPSTVPVAVPSDQTDKLLSKALEVAQSQVGVREVPPFSNRGPEVEGYLASVSLPAGQAWCAAFVYWCFEKAAQSLGMENPVYKTGGCLNHWAMAATRGARRIEAKVAEEDPSRILPGTIFIQDHGQGLGHTGIVERVEGAMLLTIEGNTNEEGGREGGGVFRRTARRIADINVGFLDYANSPLGSNTTGNGTPVEPPVGPTAPATPEGTEPEGNAEPTTTMQPTEPEGNGLPAEIAPFSPSARSGGLLRKAVLASAFEPPQWVVIPFEGMHVRVGAHTLRANVGGQLIRLPVSYQDVIAICNAQHWVPPTAGLSDAIHAAATVRIAPHPLVGNKADEAKMSLLEFALKHDKLIEADIPADRRAELASTEGKDWILSNRNLLKPRDGGGRAATTYGWHYLKDGMIQEPGPDGYPPAHSDGHSDYSQTLRPIDRKATRISDGAEVDLLAELGKLGLDARVLDPFRESSRHAEASTRGLRAVGEGEEPTETKKKSLSKSGKTKKKSKKQDKKDKGSKKRKK